MSKKMMVTRQNLLTYAAMYDSRYRGVDSEIEDGMKCRLARQHYLRRGDLVSIGRWKSPRPSRYYLENGDSRTRQVTQMSFGNPDERQRIESLLGSKGGLRGVGYPVASAILHFAFPNTYPIMDFRVIESLGWDVPSSYTFDFWQKYCTEVRKVAREHDLAISTVEKALWMYSKEKSKKCPCGDSSK
ncbi:MAG: hypothetical protein ABFE01_13835 [Phycisphaerales bacterium]